MATPEEQKEYQRLWMARRREAWIQENGPCQHCGSSNILEIDHINPQDKEFHVGAIWSWSEGRRAKELAKCQVLCHDCHLKKTNEDGSRVRGERVGASKLTTDQVLDIRARYEEGNVTLDELGEPYGMDKRYIWYIVHRKTWKHI